MEMNAYAFNVQILRVSVLKIDHHDNKENESIKTTKDYISFACFCNEYLIEG